MRKRLRVAGIAMLALGPAAIVAGCATTRYESAVRQPACNEPAPAIAPSPADGLVAEEPGLMATEDQRRARSELRKRAVPARPPEKVLRPIRRRPG